MKTFSSIFMMLHIIAGFSSLVLFWIPAFTRKGGINHNKVGRIYMWLMWIVVVTAAILSLKNFYIGQTESAIFLGFLSILTAKPLWHGVAVLNQKKGLSPAFQRNNLLFESFVCATGVALLAYGIYLQGRGGAVLMIIFGILGISGLGDILKELKQPTEKVDWFVEHMKSMLITGIAAYTAFFAFGGRTLLGNIFTGYWMIIPWVAPTVIGIVAIRLLAKYYLEKRVGKGNKNVISALE